MSVDTTGAGAAAPPTPGREIRERAASTLPGNMLVVLCSDHPTQPVVNTGTLYQ